MSVRALLAAALVFAIPLTTVAAPAKKPAKSQPFPFKKTLHTLPNGVRVVFVPYASKGLVAYYTLMRVGSRNEAEPGRSGYAHFFEHMMFRGTKRHSGDEYNKTVTRLGLNTNAFTSEDMTVYHLFGPSAALPTIIEYEADRFQNLDYTEAQFKTEAGAILGEYAKSASNPEQKLEEKMLETAFDQHTYRHTVIGYLADVQAMPSGFTYAREFFRRYYTPDNATIVVAGDFDEKQALAQITAAYASWKGKLDAVAIPPEPVHTAAREARVDWPTPTLARTWLAWHAPSSGDLKTAAVQNVLNAYLFGPTSPLHQDLVLKRQLVDSLESSYSDHRDPGLFGVLARVKADKDVPAVEAAIQAQVALLQKGVVDQARLDAVRSNRKYSAILHLDTADRVAVALAVNTAPTGDPEYFNKLYAAVDKLQPKDLVAFARTYLTDGNRTIVRLGQKTVATTNTPAATTGGAK
jgi:zinc protease